MNQQIWDFTLLDTGFFRSGQPFHAGEGGHSRITSCFPPPMSTLQGAIRSALATAYGWRPGQTQNWPEVLGNASSLGRLTLFGPYLIWKGNPLFPAPLHFLIKRITGKNNGGKPDLETTFLVPGKTYVCDLGPAVCLPRKKEKVDGAHPPQQLYLTASGYSAVARGQSPNSDEFYFHDSLWRIEPRIGLKRSAETRTAEEQHLYRIGHIRPEHHLKVRVIVKGLPHDWPEVERQIVPLGGEGRLAALEINTKEVDLFPACPRLVPTGNGKIRYTLSLITPFSINDREKLKLFIAKGPPGAPGKCISACLGKPQLYGGWDLEKQKPRPLQPYLPSGSTWFFETNGVEKENVKDWHGSLIGGKDASPYGYGQLLIGTWEAD